MEEQEKQIKKLIEAASKAHDSNDAMRFAQAALNAANAMCSLQVAKKSA